jgi:hypothetical protein
MVARRKKEMRSDWRFAMEHIGRELQKLYPGREKLPEHLREVAKGLERQTTTSHRSRTGEQEEGEDR